MVLNLNLMRNVKVFFAVLVVLVATVFIYSCAKDSTEKQSEALSKKLQTESRVSGFCEGETGVCSGPYTDKTIPVLGIPSYPLCPFTITYKYRICPQGIDLIFVGMSYQFNNPSCAQFDIDTNGPNAQQILDQVIRELINVAIETEAFDIAQPCGEVSPKLLNFFQSSCSKRCLVEVKGDGGVTIRRIVVIPCGSGCCKTGLEVCFDEFGVLKTNVISSPVPTSNCPPQPQLPCPFGTISEGVCRPSCLKVGTGG
jgi:hypothetical protein